MALTKAQIIETIQAQLGSTPKKSTECVETVLQIMKDTLASGEDILISDLMLPPRRVVTFKPSGKMKQKLNEKKRKG